MHESRTVIQRDLHRLTEQANRTCSSAETNIKHCPWAGSSAARAQSGACLVGSRGGVICLCSALMRSHLDTLSKPQTSHPPNSLSTPYPEQEIQWTSSAQGLQVGWSLDHLPFKKTMKVQGLFSLEERSQNHRTAQTWRNWKGSQKTIWSDPSWDRELIWDSLLAWPMASWKPPVPGSYFGQCPDPSKGESTDCRPAALK